MKRIRIKLDYTAEFHDDFDTSRLSSDPLRLISQGLEGFVTNDLDTIDIQAGAKLNLSFLDARKKKVIK